LLKKVSNINDFLKNNSIGRVKVKLPNYPCDFNEEFLNSLSSTVSIFHNKKSNLCSVNAFIELALDKVQIKHNLKLYSNQHRVSPFPINFRLLKAHDLNSKNQVRFPLHKIRRFLIHSTHSCKSRMFIYNEITSSIEKTFGSRQHKTTKGCLTFIQAFIRNSYKSHLMQKSHHMISLYANILSHQFIEFSANYLKHYDQENMA